MKFFDDLEPVLLGSEWSYKFIFPALLGRKIYVHIGSSWHGQGGVEAYVVSVFELHLWQPLAVK